MFTLGFEIRPVFAQGETVYINSDGSVTPSDAPISTVDNVSYAFMANMSYPSYYGIVVDRSNIVIDGDGYTVQGNDSGNGVDLTDVRNVTIENINIGNFAEGVYLFSCSNSIVSGNNVTSCVDGIDFEFSSSNNTVSGNNVTGNGSYGIFLWGSSNDNTVSGNTATGNGEAGMWLSSSSYNVVSGNNATASIGDGIDLYSSPHSIVRGNNAASNGKVGIWLGSSSDDVVNGNTATANYWGFDLQYSSTNAISGNYATANSVGIHLGDSSNNTLYNNNLVGNGVQASVDSSSAGNVWDNGYPSGGNYWSDYNGTDSQSGQYQNVTGKDGIGDTPYIENDILDPYPLMYSWTPPEIAVLNVTTSKTIIGQGYPALINVAITNLGNKVEEFTACANGTSIDSQPIIVNVGDSATISCNWNTTGFAYGVYTVSACATESETTIVNNSTGFSVIVTILGDVNGDFKVDMKDIALVARAFGSDGPNYLFQGSPPSSYWNPNADINGDDTVNMRDIALVARHFGQRYH